MAKDTNKHHGWVIMFILWNAGLLIAVLVLLLQLYFARLDSSTIAQVCAEAAVAAVKTNY